MKKIHYKYGHETCELRIPLPAEPDIIIPKPPTNQLREICSAEILDKLTLFFQNSAKDIRQVKVGIAINDKTRPVPYPRILPPMMEVLHQLGINNSQVHFYVANGTHAPDPDSLQDYFIQDYLSEYTFHQHESLNMANLLRFGITTRNNEVFLNRDFCECDLKIAVGNIEPHHFAGYSGGYKTVSIGLAGQSTITNNHKLLCDPQARAGVFLENPLRQDIEEIGVKSGLHFCLNCVMDADKNLIMTLFDTPTRVMEIAIPVVQSMYEVCVDRKYDLVIASAGGYPKDINLYQAQKALTNASQICKDGGSILLMAECIDGTGSAKFETYMRRFRNSRDLIRDFINSPFQLGNHKAFLIARILIKHKIVLQSALDPQLVRSLLLEPTIDPNQYLNTTITPSTSVAFIPNAVVTIPRYCEVADRI